MERFHSTDNRSVHMIPHMIPLLILLFLLLHTFGIGAVERELLDRYYYTHYDDQYSALDNEKMSGVKVLSPYDEKLFWLSSNQATGATSICFERLFLYPEFYEQPPALCARAQQLDSTNITIPHLSEKSYTCWYANKTVIVENAQGEIMAIFQNTESLPGIKTGNAHILGHYAYKDSSGEKKYATIIATEPAAELAYLQ